MVSRGRAQVLDTMRAHLFSTMHGLNDDAIAQIEKTKTKSL
jgi:hypothetical protein